MYEQIIATTMPLLNMMYRYKVHFCCQPDLNFKHSRKPNRHSIVKSEFVLLLKPLTKSHGLRYGANPAPSMKTIVRLLRLSLVVLALAPHGALAQPAIATNGDEHDLLTSACATMRTASGYHVDALYSDGSGKTTVSGNIAGDDYDLAINSNNRVCKVKEKFWTSQDAGQHWQESAADDGIFLLIKSILKGSSRLEDGGVIDNFRYVSLQSTVAGDTTVKCVEVWLGPLPDPLPSPLPDNESMPHYWIVNSSSGEALIERVTCKLPFHSSIVAVDATFTKVNEISIIAPPLSGSARAPYVVTTPSPGVIVVTVPGSNEEVTAPATETNSLIQVGHSQQPVRENSLGMRLVPAGTPNVLFSIWDVRVIDFRAFVDATGYKNELGHGTTPRFPQTDNDPVVSVTWRDAKMFCAWLTKKEHESGELRPNEYYRLPTDNEWSTAVGLKEDVHGFPFDVDVIGGSKIGVYPWGTQWPPPSGAGNYAESLTHDGYKYTSPVGSFPPNIYGIYDLGGNVEQWCEDQLQNGSWGEDVDGDDSYTTRGSTYDSDTDGMCSSSRRGNGMCMNLATGFLTDGEGFRVVLSNHSEISLPEYAAMIDRNLKKFMCSLWDFETNKEETAADWASYFAPISHYCYKTDGAATRDYIQHDREKLVAAWPDRDYAPIGEPVYIVSPEKNSARITVSYSFDYKNGTAEAKGVSDMALTVEMSPTGEWLITDYAETAKTNAWAQEQPVVGQAFTISALGLEMFPISAGTFTMGAEDVSAYEKPLTQVTLTKPFWLGKTGVTQGQWQFVMGANPSTFKGNDHPVETVSWDEAVAFCRKLTERERSARRLPEGYVYTLPTEAQWEYACRAGTTYDFQGNLDAEAWYSENSGNTTHPVGQKTPNDWGLYDMHGNVSEWCADWSGNYPGGRVTDPTGPALGLNHVYRGGGWAADDVNCRSTTRFWGVPGFRSKDLGFRLALASVPLYEDILGSTPTDASIARALSAEIFKALKKLPAYQTLTRLYDLNKDNAAWLNSEQGMTVARLQRQIRSDAADITLEGTEGEATVDYSVAGEKVTEANIRADDLKSDPSYLAAIADLIAQSITQTPPVKKFLDGLPAAGSAAK
jgi:formylglycine-generating enzyme required for sulfatase activity